MINNINSLIAKNFSELQSNYCSQLFKHPTKLVIGTTGDYYPFSYFDSNGTLKGFDIDLANTIARMNNFTIEFRIITWTNMLNHMQGNDDLDLIISGITITPERASIGIFSSPYLNNGIVIIGKNKTNSTISIDELIRDKVIGVNKGGYLEKFIRNRCPNARIVTTDKNMLLPTKLINGEFDFIISDSLEANYFTRKYPIVILGELHTYQHAIFIVKNKSYLLSQIESVLKKIKADGALYEIAKTHLIDDKYIPSSY